MARKTHQSTLPRRAYRVREVAEMLGLPKSTVYAMVHRGEIVAVRPGRDRKILLVPAEEIDRLLDHSVR